MATPQKKYIHPFPARMAPEIAIQALKDLNEGDIILDPMAGSGTVLHQAAINGFIPVGFDLDPLAVLMSQVSTARINVKKLQILYALVIEDVKKIRLKDIHLPWIDDDKETKDFIKFWFAPPQKNTLRKFACILDNYKQNHKQNIEIDVLRIALSRIIITKKVGASLAWDISHSRPHKMMDTNDYDVMAGFRKSVQTVIKYLEQQDNIQTKGKIQIGDARDLRSLKNESIDKVITSPPYLNAIDYMRGNKFSLVWLGFSIPKLRAVRSNSIGAEKNHETAADQKETDHIYQHIFKENAFDNKTASMLRRYIYDSRRLMSEIFRVLKNEKKATLVVGNSNLKGVYIDNAEVFKQAGQQFGLSLITEERREIPTSKRYLPISITDENSLNKRMKHEVIMTFIKRSNDPS